jgi:type II secretory pathway predicted ATPase ExeA
MGEERNGQPVTEQLMAHLGLSSDPFLSASAVFFEGAQRQHNLETLHHMAAFGDMVLMLTGDKGAGKTSLLRRFEATAGKGLSVLSLDASTDKGLKERAVPLIYNIAVLAGLLIAKGESVQHVFGQIAEKLDQRFRDDGIRTVLIIDNADQLSKKELQFFLLCFKALHQESGVILLLVGLPSLLKQASLGDNAGVDEWLHQIQLKPLSKTDLVDYLQLRLVDVGYEGSLTLTQDQLQHLVETGKGLPSRINRMFSSVLLKPGALKVVSPKVSKIPLWVSLGIVGVLCFSFLLVSYQHGLLDFDGVEVASVLESAIEVPQSGGDAFLETQKLARMKLLDTALKENTIKADSLVAEQLIELEARQTEVSSRSSVMPENEIKPKADKQAGVIDQGKILELVVSAAFKGLDREASEKQKTESVTKVDERVVLAEPLSADVAVKSVVKPDVKPTVVVNASSPAHQSFRNKAWVLKRSSSSYSAQILGSYKEQTARDFIDKIGKLDQEIYYLKTLRKGKPWFVVFYGLFSDKNVAKAALANSPAIIVSQGPWLRRFDGILKSYP